MDHYHELREKVYLAQRELWSKTWEPTPHIRIAKGKFDGALRQNTIPKLQQEWQNKLGVREWRDVPEVSQ